MDTTTEDLDVSFEAAFAEALDDAPAAQEPAPQEPIAGVLDEQTETQDETPPVEAAEQGGGDESPKDPAPAVEPAAAPVAAQPAEPAVPGLDPKFLAQAIAEAQQQADAQRQQQTEAQHQQEQQAKDAIPDDYLDDRAKQSIEAFKKDWPTEFEAIEKLMDARVKAAVANVERQQRAMVDSALAPVAQVMQQSQVSMHQSTIASRHPDFGPDMVNDMAAWIATQNPLVRPAYQQAFDKGNTQQVVQLIDLYKEATGKTGAAPAAPAPSTQPATVKPQTQPVNPKAVAATAAPPAAKRTAPAAQKDSQDFGSAFQDALRAMG